MYVLIIKSTQINAPVESVLFARSLREAAEIAYSIGVSYTSANPEAEQNWHRTIAWVYKTNRPIPRRLDKDLLLDWLRDKNNACLITTSSNLQEKDEWEHLGLKPPSEAK